MNFIRRIYETQIASREIVLMATSFHLTLQNLTNTLSIYNNCLFNFRSHYANTTANYAGISRYSRT